MSITDTINKYLTEASDPKLDAIAKAIKGKSLMSLRDPLNKMFKKKDVDYVNSPMPMFIIKSGGKKIVIANKKYADDADMIVGDLAIGYMN